MSVLTITPGAPTAPDKWVIRIAGNVVRDDDAKPLLFETEAEARAWVEQMGDHNADED